MNFKREKYPNNIREVIRKAEKTLKGLNFKSAPRLKDLLTDQSLRKAIPKSSCLYIFIDKSKPIYIGISRNVRLRLRQHGWGKIYHHATLAYLITAHETKYVTKRSKLDYSSVAKAQKKIRNYGVIIIPVEDNDPYLLYFLEIYLAGCLKTKWNTFRTH